MHSQLVSQFYSFFECQFMYEFLEMNTLGNQLFDTKNKYYMEYQRQQKQQFLRDQILNGGFDPSDFMNFMAQFRNKEINIDQWSMQQLNDVVQQFKKTLNQYNPIDSQVPGQLESKKTKQQIVSQIKGYSQSKIKVKYTVFGRQNVQDLQLNVKEQCKKIQQKIFIPPNTKFQAKAQAFEVKKVGGLLFGIGASNELNIKISNNLNDIKVIRKSQDFQWLRNALIKKYPGSYVPALSPQRSIQPEDQASIKHRVAQVVNFINKVAYFDYLVHNRFFTDFMFEKEVARFNAVKNREKQSPSISDISKIQNNQGSYEAQISGRVLSLIKSASNYGKRCDQYYGALDNQISKILTDMQSIAKYLMKLSKQCFNLTQSYQKMQVECGIPKGQMKSVFKYLNSLFATTANSTRHQINAIKDFYQGFVKQVKYEWQTFNAFDRKRQYFLQQYLDSKQNLARKKEKYLSDPMKWDLPTVEYQRIMKGFNPDLASKNKDEYMQIMLPKQTQSLQCMRIWQAYNNKIYQKSFTSLLKMQQAEHVTQIKEVTFKIWVGSRESQDLFERFSKLYGKTEKT